MKPSRILALVLMLMIVQSIGWLQLKAAAQTSNSRGSSDIGIRENPCDGLPTPPDPAKFRATAASATGKTNSTASNDALFAAYEEWRRLMLYLDFGGLCRYEAANSQLPPASSNRIVFFGDSITEGWRTADPKLFSGDNINRGISGQTTSQMLVRFRSDVLELKPKIVHILAGTNDIAGNTGPTTLKRTEAAIASMAELAQAHNVKVVLASVLPAKKYPWSPFQTPAGDIIKLNAWLRSYAEANGILYIDYHSVLEDTEHGLRKELSTDGVHLNAKGYEVMKEVLFKVVKLDDAVDSRVAARSY